MAILTITEPSADDITRLVYAKKLRASNQMDLENDTKYAVVVLKLANAVTPADYPALKTNIIAVTGVQDVDLLFDHQTRATVPANHTQVLRCGADITLRDDTPIPE